MMSGYPTPWIVGPFGDIWVAADVEFRDGKWHETVPDPRLVVACGKSRALAEQIVSAVNAAAQAPLTMSMFLTKEDLEAARTAGGYSDQDDPRTNPRPI